MSHSHTISILQAGAEKPQLIETSNFMLILTDEAGGITVGGVANGVPMNEWLKTQNLYNLALVLSLSPELAVRLLGEQAVALVQGWERGVRVSQEPPRLVPPPEDDAG